MSVLVYLFLGAFVLYVLWTWLGWIQSGEKLAIPKWRGVAAVIGFTSTTTSLLLILVLAVHALLTGGFPYYHPTLMLAFAIGFLTAMLGVVAAIAGKGPLEVPTIISSILCLLIWFVEAIAQ